MVSLKAATMLAACLPSIAAVPIFKRQSNFDYSTTKVKGVNLGGWFVLEPFINPSIFEPYASGSNPPVDEYTLCAQIGTALCQSLLSAHWGSWITQADMQEIASIGLNHVRIPIGYWALNPLPGDPYVQGQLDYLDTAIGWAGDAGLHVWLDLHGAPGSQNGFDNSGRRGAIAWDTGDTVAQTLTALKALADRYASNPHVAAIELLNEPFGPSLNLDDIKAFYGNGYGTVRGDNANIGVVIHDAFQDIQSYWNGFMNPESGDTNVILDTHIYQIFSNDQVAMKPCDHIQAACEQAGTLAGTDKYTVVGEWTGAQTDCAMWLNGLGIGARYDGTYSGSSYIGDCKNGKYSGTVDGMLDVDKTNLAYFVEAQMDAYEAHTGWIFWNWKTESAPEWHMQNLTRAGLIPNPVTARNHPGQCQASTCMIPGN